MMIKGVIVLLSALTSISSARGQDVVFSAKPSDVVNGTTKSLEIECRAPFVDEETDLVVLMLMDQVDDDDVIKPIASDRGAGPTLHVEDNRTSVEGQLHGGTFLKVTVTAPEVSDTGKYQCRFAFLKMAEFRFVLLNKTTEVTFTEPDELTPAPMLLPESCSCDQVWDEVKDLRATLIAENKQLKDKLKSYDDSCRVSFTARLTELSGRKFFSNQPMVFDSVLTNRGQAYDVTSGAFTAPCSGHYFFRLSMRSRQDRDTGYVDGAIEVNGEQMARTSVFSDDPIDHYEQASNGLVLSLAEGDEVLVRIHTNSEGSIYGDVFSIFSGFFISA